MLARLQFRANNLVFPVSPLNPTPALMKTRLLILLQALAFCALLSSCANYARVKEKRLTFRPVTGTVKTVADVAQCIDGALKARKHDPMKALAGYIEAASKASDELAKTSKDEVLRDEYNFAVSRIFDTLNTEKIDPWTQPLTIPADKGGWVLSRKADARKEWNPALYQLKPADQFDTNGIYVNERHLKPGIGAPLVAIGKETNMDNAKKNFALARIYYGVTAVARFNGKRCEITFLDPLAVETVSLNGHTFPLAADFTVPVAVMLAEMNPMKLDLARLLNPEKFAETARIARLQPYDPNKTVVLVVHGLNSSPATWAPMINALRANETIRKYYQFWFYSYPSGYPYPHAAALLRKELDSIEKRFPLKKKMVVIGHSMGGCISRLLITDVGDQLWQKVLGKPVEEVRMSEKSKQLFKDALVFHERPDVGRVIFIAAPLRGADMAAGWMGRLGAKLVKAPATLANAGREVLGVMTFNEDDLRLQRIPNSVDTLAPNARFVKAINTFPPSSKIPYHSIVGDRGKGGSKDKTKPVQSDGLVPYWSSHLDGAKSEITVPSGHNAHQNEKAIEEVRRILLLHTKTGAK